MTKITLSLPADGAAKLLKLQHDRSRCGKRLKAWLRKRYGMFKFQP